MRALVTIVVVHAVATFGCEGSMGRGPDIHELLAGKIIHLPVPSSKSLELEDMPEPQTRTGSAG